MTTAELAIKLGAPEWALWLLVLCALIIVMDWAAGN